MREDLHTWLEGERPQKLPSKETLNHPELIGLATGLDPFLDTPRAYKRAYEALGIDLINVEPEENAPVPLLPGQVKMQSDGVMEGYLGVFNASSRVEFPFKTTEEFWNSDIAALEYSQLDLPGAQYMMECRRDVIERKMDFIGDVGIYYYQLYTTLFMWGVEALGWEIFMESAAEDPERFDRHFLSPVFEKSKEIVTMLSELDCPLVFCHDDIALGSRPAFRPDWYETYIFPRYADLWSIPHDRGKKVIFVSDGKLDWALEPLRRTGIDGLMFETPRTDLDAVIDVFGDKIFIGGIDVQLLTRAAPEDVHRHTLDVVKRGSNYSGFVLCCSGGLNGNIPLINAEAYFDARVEVGFTKPGWRHSTG
jgi:hypothetical protein